MRKYRVHIAVALVLLLLIAVHVLAALTRRKPEFDVVADRSTYRFNWYGWRAFYATLARLGYRVGRWEKRPQELPPDCAQLWLIMPSEDLEPAELRALRRFVQRGGVLVASWERSIALGIFDSAEAREAFPELAALDLDEGLYTMFFYAPHVVEKEKTYELQAAAGNELTRDVKKVIGANGTRVEKPNAPGAEVVLRDGWGPAVITQPVGEGLLVFFADPDILGNRFLKPEERDNVVFGVNVAELARGGRILFDEYHHGFRAAETLGALFLRWSGRFGALQVLAVVVLALACAARRFGGVRPLRLPRRRSALEYVDSLAALYQSADAREVAAWSLYHAARRRLAGASRLSTAAPDAALAQQAAARWGMDPAAVERALGEARAAAEQCAGDRQLVRVARMLEALRREQNKR